MHSDREGEEGTVIILLFRLLTAPDVYANLRQARSPRSLYRTPYTEEEIDTAPARLHGTSPP